MERLIASVKEREEVGVQIVFWKPCYCYEMEFFSYNGVNKSSKI